MNGLLAAALPWAREADPGFFWAALACAAVLSLASFYFSFRSFRLARLIEDTPTSKIVSASQGHVELSGTGSLLKGAVSACPLTDTAALWYRYSVDKKEVRTDKNGRHTAWVRIDSGVSREAFWLEDGTGLCLVHPAGAEVTPHLRRRWRGNSVRPYGGPPAEGAFWGFLSWSFGEYRYTEELLVPARPVFALGWFETIRPGRGVEDDVNERLRAVKADQRALLDTFDANRDGVISPEEWDAVRAAVREDVLRARAADRPAEPVNTLTIPAAADLPFLISGLPQVEAARRCRLKAAGALAVFFLLGAAASRLAGERGFRWEALSGASKTGTVRP